MARILLDENLDWRLSRDLRGHTVESVPLIGWAGLENGELLSQAEKGFDVFITMDSNLAYQRNIANYKIAVVVLQAASNRLADTRPLMAKVASIANNIHPGTLKIISL
jgi:hypothetical protein